MNSFLGKMNSVDQVTKKKKIIVVPSAGLGNRMRVLSSCIYIAKRDDRILYIAWPKNPALYCEMTDVFESIGMEYQVPPKWLHFFLIQIYRHGAIRRFPKILKFMSNIFFDNAIFDADTEFNENLELDSNDRSILVATCFAFGNKADFKSFKFIDKLRNEANLQYQKIGEPFIGVHIRRTDHTDLINLSPIDNYLTQIDKCLADRPAQKFFLATDDDETKLQLKQKYKNLLYTFEHKLGRKNLEGINGAVIELLLLSRSSIIICSPISSYSDTAILIGGIQEVINV